MTDLRAQPYLVISSPSFGRYRSGEDGDWTGGIRPPHIVETAEDVIWMVDNADADTPQIVCGFCATTYRVTGSAVAALRWFNTHACKGTKCLAA